MMGAGPYASPLDVFLVLSRGDEVLLALRENTGYADGQWNLPSGKVEQGEHILAAVLREAREEVGLRLEPGDVRLAATVHLLSAAGQGRLGLFFHVTHDPGRHGEPVNAEPHKCAGIGWYPADGPPVPTVPYTVAGVESWRNGVPLALVSWPGRGSVRSE
jgi:8-oxo-dGTP pyrophosphatase MutT (NUDIX family)